MTTSELVAAATLLLSVLTAWGITSFKYGRMGTRVDHNEKRIKSLEESREKIIDAIAIHKNEQIPHATCVGHTVTIQNIEKNIDAINTTLGDIGRNILDLSRYVKQNGNGNGKR